MSEGMSNWEGPKDPIKKGKKEIKKNETVGVELDLHIDRNDPLNKKMLQERGLVVGKDGKLYPKKTSFTVVGEPRTDLPKKKSVDSKASFTVVGEPRTDLPKKKSVDTKPSFTVIGEPRTDLPKKKSDEEKPFIQLDDSRTAHEALLDFENSITTKITKELQPALWKYRESTSLTMRLPNKLGGKIIGKDGNYEMSIGYKIADGVKTIYVEKSDGKTSIYEGYTVLEDKVIKFTIKNGKQEKTVCTVRDLIAFSNSSKAAEKLQILTDFVSKNSTYQPQFLKNESSAIDPLSIYTQSTK